MNTKQIEKLYIAHAADFRELLDVADPCAMAQAGNVTFCLNKAGWYFRCLTWGDLAGCSQIPTPLAVAAVAEFWQQRLEEKHGVWLMSHNQSQFYPIRGKNSEEVLGCGGTKWVNSVGFIGRDCGTSFGTLPEAICAAVKALAAEKREKAKVEPVWGVGIAQMLIDARLRQIVPEELAKTTPPISNSIFDACYNATKRIQAYIEYATSHNRPIYGQNIMQTIYSALKNADPITPNKEPQSDRENA